MSNNNIQEEFFKRLKDKIGPKISFPDKIAELLDISSDSAYRRIRGETALTLSEAKTLADQFSIPFESVSNSGDQSLGFTYKMLDDQEITFENYLTSIQIDVQGIEHCEDKEIIYAAKDIPIFHHFNFPELAAFKIFYWMKSIMNVPKYESQKFDFALIDQKFIEMGRRMIRAYEKVPTTEIWTEETVNSTVKQIEYYWDSGFFMTKHDALMLCKQLAQLMDHVKLQAVNEKNFQLGGSVKENAAAYKMYYSEVMIGNNSVLVNTNGTEATYVSHNTLNYLITKNESFCKETSKSLKNLIKKSILISGLSEKHRNIFFNKAHEIIDQLVTKIESSKIS